MISRPEDRAAPEKATTKAPAVVSQLVASFEDHVKRALDFDLDGSVTSLAWVDHYLQTLRGEDRVPILELVAAEAGAYFGEVVRTTLGGFWLGDGEDPRRLRMLLSHQLLHFSPVDQAYEVLIGEDADEGDLRLPSAPPLDPDFRPNDRPPRAPEGAPKLTGLRALSDAEWLGEALSARPELDESAYFSLTGRLETLELLLELLAHRCADEGREPREYGVGDYVSLLVEPSAADNSP